MVATWEIIILYSGTVAMSRHARGLRAETDGRAQQARAATGERRPPAGRSRRLGRGRGIRGRTDGRACTSKAGQTWQTDWRAGGRTSNAAAERIILVGLHYMTCNTCTEII